MIHRHVLVYRNIPDLRQTVDPSVSVTASVPATKHVLIKNAKIRARVHVVITQSAVPSVTRQCASVPLDTPEIHSPSVLSSHVRYPIKYIK